MPVLDVPAGSLERQMARLERTRRERDAAAIEAALAGLRDAASRPGSTETNLMPHFIRAAEAYATLGEMCGVLRGRLRGVPRAGRGLIARRPRRAARSEARPAVTRRATPSRFATRERVPECHSPSKQAVQEPGRECVAGAYRVDHVDGESLLGRHSPRSAQRLAPRAPRVMHRTAVRTERRVRSPRTPVSDDDTEEARECRRPPPR